MYTTVMSRLAGLGIRLFIVELGDNNPHIAHPRLPAGYTTETPPVEKLRAWAGLEHSLSHRFLDEAIERGDRCVANFYNGELVGYGFVTRSRAPVTDQLEVLIDDHLRYRYKGWTHPAHRRKHLSHARGRINSTLFPMSDGHRMVSYVDSHNFASRLKHPDVHPVRLGYAGYVTFFGEQYPFTGRIPRRFGFELRRISRAKP